MNNAELEIILSNYRLLEKAYHNERTNILHPYMETDTNTGGSSSGRISNPTASTAIALVEDDDGIQKHYRAIQRTYLKMDAEKQRTMEFFYFNRPYGVKNTGIALRLNIDIRTLKRWRECICCELDKQLGGN